MSLYNFVKNSKEENTPNKDKVRQETINYIVEEFKDIETKRVKFLTLPSAWWKFETNIHDKFKEKGIYSYFYSCEKEWKVFQLACLNIPRITKGHKQGINCDLDEKLNCQLVTSKLGYKIWNTDIFDYIKSEDRTYHCIWLDLMCPITNVADKLIELKKVLKDKGLLIITVLKARENIKISSRMDYINDSLKDLNVTLISKYEYIDSSPMLHLIYKKL